MILHEWAAGQAAANEWMTMGKADEGRFAIVTNAR
jgi:hypothetical protein